jgi:hypothetical protein
MSDASLLSRLHCFCHASEREQEIRRLIFLIVRVREPEKRKVLAAELERLLRLEGKKPKHRSSSPTKSI